ncbi:MAG: flagellar filament capping protein FliD [Pseudomonadota bacterium]
MPTDFLTTLNGSGSGINITELAEVLTEAEISPRRTLITDRIDRAELQQSGYAQLRTQAQQINEALSVVSTLSSYAISSDNSAVTASITDPAAVSAESSIIEVTQLAASQVLNFGGFTDPDAALGAGSITIEFGTWSDDVPPVFTASTDPSQTLELQENATLNDLATALGSLEGVSARVIDVGDGTYTLGVISQTGADNALNITVSADAAADLQAFDISADPTSVQAQAAQNAEFTFNGIDITRPSNEVDDLIPGVSLTLTTPTTIPANISAFSNADGALEVMQGFVEILNATVFLVSALTDQGFVSGGEPGALAGESLADRFLSQFQSNLSGGFGSSDGSSDTFLADLGILTERDGTYSLNETQFTAALSSDPLLLAPLLRDTLEAENATITGTPSTPPDPGSYAFERDATTGSATLGGQPLYGVEQSDGSWLYTVSLGDLQGISISVQADVTSTTVNFAPSMVSTLEEQMSDFTSSNGALATRDAALSSSISDEEEALEALDRRAEALEERYLARFTQMEQIITQLNSTGEYLQNLLDAQNRDN